MLPREFYQRDPVTCARELIGCELVWAECRGRIVETEAYTEFGDEACHTFWRPSTRQFVSTQPAGTAYVYLNYGMHWMLNVLIKNPAANGFVLIRAVEPTVGIGQMELRRRTTALRNLCSGPGKLSMAFAINRTDHGCDLCSRPMHCFAESRAAVEVQADARVGISRAMEKPWRFLLKDSRFVSLPFGRALKLPKVKSAAFTD